MAELIGVDGDARTIGIGGGVVIYDVGVDPNNPYWWTIGGSGSGGGGGGLPIPPSNPAPIPPITGPIAGAGSVIGAATAASQLLRPWFFSGQPETADQRAPTSDNTVWLILGAIALVIALVLL